MDVNMNVKKLLQKIVENQRVSYMRIGLSSNTTVSISEPWTWVTLPLDSIRSRDGLFASSSISNNCIVIPKDGIYRLSGVFSTQNGAYCSISVNGTHIGVAGMQSQASYTSAPIGMTIQRLKSGDMVGLLIEKSSSSNPIVAGANYTCLLVEKIG